MLCFGQCFNSTFKKDSFSFLLCDRHNRQNPQYETTAHWPGRPHWWVLNWAGKKAYRDRKEKTMKKYNEEWQEVREKARRETESWKVPYCLTLRVYSGRSHWRGIIQQSSCKCWKSSMCKSNRKEKASFGRESAVFKAHLMWELPQGCDGLCQACLRHLGLDDLLVSIKTFEKPDNGRVGAKGTNRCNLITCTCFGGPIGGLLYPMEGIGDSIYAVRNRVYCNLHRSYALLLSCAASVACTTKGY